MMDKIDFIICRYHSLMQTLPFFIRACPELLIEVFTRFRRFPFISEGMWHLLHKEFVRLSIACPSFTSTFMFSPKASKLRVKTWISL